MHTRFKALTLAVAALAVACEDDGTQPANPTIPASELAQIALDTDALVGVVLDDLGAARDDAGIPAPTMDLIVTDASFTRTRTCPAGGQVLIEGTAHREFDTETRVMEADYSGTRARQDCAFVREELTVTVNGSAEWTAERRRVEGAFDGPQVSTHAGSFSAVRSDGAERSCDFDVEVVRDPDANTVTITGTICGEAVERMREWHR